MRIIRRLCELFTRHIIGCRLEIVYLMQGIAAVSDQIRFLRKPIHPMRRWRAQIGSNTLVYPGVTLHAATNDFSNLRVGSNARILRECILDLTDSITIEDDAVLSFRCTLITHRNVARSPLSTLGYEATQAPITVKRGAVIFANATVLMGVTIGECAIVAAGAVVRENVPPWTLVAGVPAKVIRPLPH